MSRRNRAELEGVETSPDGRYIRFDEKLGSGAYKSVWLAYDTDLGIEVAWNTVDLKRLPEKEKIRLKSETDILKNLNHNCIINFYNSWENPELEQVIFTTEIVTSGTLKQYVSRFKPIKLRVIKKWCRQILQGLCYLHSKNPPIIHRDLKCDNIFINGSTGDIRIGDLGLSTMRNATHAASVLGTPEFMAPELYDEWYTEKVDVYAFGMVVLEMISNEYPYAECTNTAQIFKKVSAGIRPESLNRLQSRSTREFIELCLAKSNVRLAAEDLAKHPFLDPRFCDYRERFPIVYDPIVTTTNSSTPLVPVMELAAVAEHSQHSLEKLTIKEEDSDQISESNEMSFLEVLLENTVDNISRVVLTLDLGNRRKEIKFPFDLDSDTAEAVAIEMVKELGLQQSSVNKLSDGIYAAIKEEKIKWSQTKLLLGQGRAAAPVLIDGFSSSSQPAVTAATVTAALLPPTVPVNTALHSVPVVGSAVPSSFPSSLLAPSLKSLPTPLPVSTAIPSLAPNVPSHGNSGVLAGIANPTGVLSNVATDAPMIDPFTGAPLQPSAAIHPDPAQLPVSEPVVYSAQQQQPQPLHQQTQPSQSLLHQPPLPQQQQQQQQHQQQQQQQQPQQQQPPPFGPVSTAGFTNIPDFPVQQSQGQIPSFTSNTPASTFMPQAGTGNGPFPTSGVAAGTLPKPNPQSQRNASVPSASIEHLLANVSSAPNLQTVASSVAPPSSFASSSYPQGPSPVISAGSFTQTSSAIPYAAQPPSSFQSAQPPSSFQSAASASNVSMNSLSYISASAFSASTLPPAHSNGAPVSAVQASLVQQSYLAPPHQQPPGNFTVAQQNASVPISQPGISVPSSQISLGFPSTQTSLTLPSSQVPGTLPSSTSPASSQSVAPSPGAVPYRPDSVNEPVNTSTSPTGSQPSVLASPPCAPRFIKRRSIEEIRFPDNSSQDGDSQPNPAINSESSNIPSSKPVKNTPDQALDISNFLSGFDVSQLSSHQLTTLKDLRSQLDDSIRVLKTQYASMYREAVNKYKMEVVDNLTGWGFPIPPLNIKVQGLGSARGNQQGALSKSVNHLSRRTRDVISLAHGSSNDLISLESNLAGSNNIGSASNNSSLPPVPSQAADPDHIYNRLIQPFAPVESSSEPSNNNNSLNSETKAPSSILGLVPGPGPNWPPKVDPPLDPVIWDSSSQSPSS